MKEQQNKSKEERNSVSLNRRKLLKASAAAPLLATLHPGAAMAASSAFACAGGDFSNMKFEAHGNSINGDTAVRVEVDFYKHKNPNDIDPSLPKSKGNSHPQRLYDIDGVLYSQDSVAYYDFSGADLDNYYEPPEKAWVLVIFDVENRVPLGPWPSVPLENGQALTASCWSSINPNYTI